MNSQRRSRGRPVVTPSDYEREIPAAESLLELARVRLSREAGADPARYAHLVWKVTLAQNRLYYLRHRMKRALLSGIL